MAKTTRVRICTYARVSPSPNVEEGKSIPAQLAEIHEFVDKREGWEVVVEFTDLARTGTDMDRPGLQAMLAAAEQGTFDVLIVHELSRLSRRIFDTFAIFDKLGRLSIGFASVKEPDFDFSSPTGRLFLTILAALNQYYIDLIKMHTAKSKRQRAREGLYNASVPPFGYEHTGDQNTPPVIVPEEAKAVREIFERYSTGQTSYLEVADWLNDAGFRTRSGNRFSKDTIADMLRNPFYKGYVLYRPGSRSQDEGELFPGKHEAMVSSELWDLCRRVREQRRTAPRTYQPQYRVYLLNGLVTCDVCGRKLRAQGAKTGNYYREMSRSRGFVDCPHAGRGVRCDTVDAQIAAIFRNLRLPPDWQDTLMELVDQDDDRDVLDSRRARLVAERRRLKEMKIQGEFDDDLDLYDREQSRIARELAEIPEMVDDLEAVHHAASTLEELASVWDETSDAEKRDLLRLALREVKIDVVQGRVSTVEPFPIFVPLFRQLDILRETRFGVFVPLWTPELVEKGQFVPLLPATETVPEPETALDWPVAIEVPTELEGKRITPVLSNWLKEERKQGNEEAGRVVEMRNAPFPLQIDLRKWPDVAIEQVADLQTLPNESVSLLWTPFAVQRAKDRVSLVAQARRVLRPGGTWAFMDVLPVAMPGHWLYRFFPQVWSNEEASTWDTSQLYNQLVQAGLRVKLTRHNYHQPIASGTAYEIARRREAIPQLATLFDEVYESGLAVLQEEIERKGKDSVVGSEFCLIEVLAVRG